MSHFSDDGARVTPSTPPAPGTFTLRAAQPDDAASVAEVFLRSFRHAYRDTLVRLAHPDHDVRHWVRDEMLAQSCVTVAVSAGVVVGYVATRPQWIEHLYVDPPWIGLGIGSALLTAARERLPGGCDLWTFQENGRARGFYESHGFSAIGFTDGDNEERQPDVRYHWEPNEMRIAPRARGDRHKAFDVGSHPSQRPGRVLMSQGDRESALAVAKAANPYQASFLEHEFETYALLREQCPVARSEAAVSQGMDGMYLLTRYDHSTEFLQDWERFSNQTQNYPVRPWIPQAIDPPAQVAYRRIFNPWFTVDEMRPLEPYLQKFAEEICDRMLEKDTFDFVAEYADPFPTQVFCQLAGFPLEDYQQIMDWKNTLMHVNDGHSRGRELAAALAGELGIEVPAGSELSDEASLAVRGEAGQRIYRYLAGLIEKRRAEPQEDMISKLIASSYEGERPLSEEELEDTLFLFYMAGLDTVASILGLVVRTFAENPDKRREFIDLMEDDLRVGPAVEELVRYHSIVLLPRRVTADTEFHGASLKAQETVMCPTMAANRDPEEFPNPDELVFDRLPNRHIGFGLGPHRCIGIHLARREVRIALQVFHRRCPNYAIDPNGTVEAFASMKGLAALPLVKA